MEKLHSGARWQFRISGYLLIGFLGIFFGLWIIASLVTSSLLATKDSSISIMTIIFLIFIGYFLFVIIVSEIYARMSYNRWFYEFNDEGLRLERGIIWKRYSNVPYERIQNVDVHRGVIARMLGFSSLKIQTAGYSATPYSEGNIPAVDINKAEQIRNFIMKKITRKRER